MSYFTLIEVEKEKSESFSDYSKLNMNRESVYRVFEISADQYGNKYKRLLMESSSLIHAKKFLRSCRLIAGIEIKE